MKKFLQIKEDNCSLCGKKREILVEGFLSKKRKEKDIKILEIRHSNCFPRFGSSTGQLGR